MIPSGWSFLSFPAVPDSAWYNIVGGFEGDEFQTKSQTSVLGNPNWSPQFDLDARLGAFKYFSNDNNSRTVFFTGSPASLPYTIQLTSTELTWITVPYLSSGIGAERVLRISDVESESAYAILKTKIEHGILIGGGKVGDYTISSGQGVAIRMLEGNATLTLLPDNAGGDSSGAGRRRLRRLQETREGELVVNSHEHSMTVYSTVYVCGEQVSGTLHAIMDGRSRGSVEEHVLSVSTPSLSHSRSHVLLVHGDEEEGGDQISFELIRYVGQNEVIVTRFERTITFQIDGYIQTIKCIRPEIVEGLILFHIVKIQFSDSGLSAYFLDAPDQGI